MEGDIDGWICCCKGPILDPHNPAKTIMCCGNYEWSGKGEPTLPHNQREAFAAFLFDRSEFEVLDIKFLRGTSPHLTADKLCATAQKVLEEFLSADDFTDKPPSGRTPQRDIAEIVARYPRDRKPIERN